MSLFDEKNEYKMEKKKNYTFDDYVYTTKHFNKLLLEFLDELCAICVENKWRQEVDDMKSYISTIELGISANKFIAAQTFARTVYVYYNFLKIKDENALLKANYSGAVSNDATSMLSILNYKKLWMESGDCNKEYIFQALIHICSILEHFEEIAFSLKYINNTTTPYALPYTITPSIAQIK